MYKKSLTNHVARELDYIIENKLKYSDIKTLVHYMNNNLNISLTKNLVNDNGKYRILFQINLFNLDEKTINSIYSYVNNILKRY